MQYSDEVIESFHLGASWCMYFQLSVNESETYIKRRLRRSSANLKVTLFMVSKILEFVRRILESNNLIPVVSVRNAANTARKSFEVICRDWKMISEEAEGHILSVVR